MYLVGERAGHDKTGVSSGASQVQQATFSQHNDSMAVWEDEPVTLGLDVLPLDALPLHEASHVDLIVKVTNVTNNGVVLHLGHVGGHDDVLVAGGGHEDITGVQTIVQRQDSVACNRCNMSEQIYSDFVQMKAASLELLHAYIQTKTK